MLLSVLPSMYMYSLASSSDSRVFISCAPFPCYYHFAVLDPHWHAHIMAMIRLQSISLGTVNFEGANEKRASISNGNSITLAQFCKTQWRK